MHRKGSDTFFQLNGRLVNPPKVSGVANRTTQDVVMKGAMTLSQSIRMVSIAVISVNSVMRGFEQSKNINSVSQPPTLKKPTEEGKQVLPPREKNVLNDIFNRRTYTDEFGTEWYVDDDGKVVSQVPKGGDAPAVGGAGKGVAVIVKGKDGVLKIAKQGSKIHKQIIEALKKNKLTTSRGKATDFKNLQIPESGVKTSGGPKSFWQKVKEIGAILGTIEY